MKQTTNYPFTFQEWVTSSDAKEKFRWFDDDKMDSSRKRAKQLKIYSKEMANLLSQTKKQQILELFLCGNDQRLRIIAEAVGCNQSTVSNVIQDYYDKKLPFERGNYKILHSSINND